MAYGNLKFHLFKESLGRRMIHCVRELTVSIVLGGCILAKLTEKKNIVDTISIPWSWFTADVRLIVLLCFIFFCSIRKGILLICFILEPFDENMFSLLFLKEKKYFQPLKIYPCVGVMSVYIVHPSLLYSNRCLISGISHYVVPAAHVET